MTEENITLDAHYEWLKSQPKRPVRVPTRQQLSRELNEPIESTVIDDAIRELKGLRRVTSLTSAEAQANFQAQEAADAAWAAKVGFDEPDAAWEAEENALGDILAAESDDDDEID